MRRRLDAFVQQSLVSPLRAFAATVLRPHVPHRVRHWSLDQASHELREARHLLNSRIRANTVTPADLDRVASAHRQVLRLRLGL